ncbi:histidinol-phosphate aminotransferase [Volucribacter psittacicida]|uniref:Histidinol-phosphate aminotransferase n=1 Tax=Volucribacter psittacicida TaxID=203482 RepID=A0A4R1FJ36_9PAST|nr:histidinol-phosphate transaminase [Volucribacter psittacicida]TCJ94817.1 histidinol-phosphate aminotransferase [Volucribacter psittacicida]
MKFINIANEGVKHLSPYQAGKPIEELERELGIANIIKLASNENPFGFPESAKQAIQAQLADLTRYPDSNGFYFKQKVADKFGLSAEQITLGNGSNDLLELIFQTFVSERDEVIFSQYTFIVAPLATQARNAKAVVVPAVNYGHDLSGFLTAISPATKLIYIANPNNPTGTFLSHQQIADFLAQVPEHILVVLDEAYTEFTQPQERVNAFALLQQYPNLVVCRTLSKAYGLAGLRLGYAVSCPEIAGLFNRVRQPFNCNSLALAAGMAVLDDEQFIAQVAENNQQGLALLQQFFAEKGLNYVPSKGNFVLLDVGQPALPIYQALLEQGVIVRPVAGYGLPHHLRVSIGLPEENQRFLTALSKVLGL